MHYGETSLAERFNLLQKLRKMAHKNATANGQKTKEQYDKKAMLHPFKIGDKVLIANNLDTTKNPKLVPNWKGPGKIIYINYTNPKIKFKNKIKVLNVAKLKHFYKNMKNPLKRKVTPTNLIKILIRTMRKRSQTLMTFLIKRTVKDPLPGPKQN